jgi:hypothetical protein
MIVSFQVTLGQWRDGRWLLQSQKQKKINQYNEGVLLCCIQWVISVVCWSLVVAAVAVEYAVETVKLNEQAPVVVEVNVEADVVQSESAPELAAVAELRFAQPKAMVVEVCSAVSIAMVQMVVVVAELNVAV